MKRKIIILILLIVLILVGKVQALTLTHILGNEYIQQTVEENEHVRMIFTSKDGFRFKKWIIEQGNIGVDINDNDIEFDMPNENVTIRAEYDSEYEITFHSNDGTERIETMTVVAGRTEQLIANSFTRDGYRFIGWSEELAGTVKFTDEEECTPEKDLDLYAIWEINEVIVQFNTNGGSAVDDKPVIYGATYGELPTSTKTGYTFNGWYKESGLTNQVTSETAVTETTTHTLYAKWTANTYYVKYNGNGGSGSMSNSEHTYGTSSNLRQNAFTKTGYTFAGWAESASGSVKYADKASVSTLIASGTKTLYAKWTANTYTVVYNGNGNTSGSTADSSHTYGTAKALTTNGYEKDGYTFIGWAESADGEVKYTDGESVSNLTTTANGTVTLYAKWKTSWNEPVVGSGMRRVNWDSINKEWVEASASTWDYNYTIATAGTTTVEGDGTAKWANAMIDGDEDGEYESYYVWIPRFTYKVTTGNSVSWNSTKSGTKTAKTEIKFSNGTDDYTTGDYSGYSKHSAFTLKDKNGNVVKELEGFWVAKFEASNTSSKPLSRPGVKSWRDITASNMFNYGKNLDSSIGSHMLKDSEWGAVAYLTSAVGRIPYINSSSNFYTGYANTKQDGDGSLVSNYASTGGVKASTTHNIYGVYDMSGGAWEYTAAYYSGSTSSYIANYTSSYSSNGTTYVDYYTTQSPTGDCARLGWDSDTAESLAAKYPVLARGGYYGFGSSAGVFHSYCDGAQGGETVGFRVALWGFSL